MTTVVSGREGLRVAVVGLGFGADFVPLYLAHPDVGDLVLIDPDPVRRRAVASTYALDGGHDSLDDALAAERIDAVHLLTPVPTHAALTLRCLQEGLHVACAVPMATTLEDLELIIAASEAAGLVYQMMETSVFGREFRYVQDLHSSRRSRHDHALQRVSRAEPRRFSRVLAGLSTHALPDPRPQSRSRPARHRGDHRDGPGSGVLTDDRRSGGFDNPFPAEVGLFTLRSSAAIAQVTMAFFQTGRSYYEGFSVYGDHGGVEWPADNDGPLTVYAMTGPAAGSRGNQVRSSVVRPPDETDDLPEALRRFVADGGHGGSHPFLVDSFVSAVLGRSTSPIDARTAAAWTAPGICAHSSALADGRSIDVPSFRKSAR